MVRNKENFIITVKYLISLYISIKIANIVCNFFEKASVNVWFARGIGATVCVLLGLMFYHLWIKKKKKKEFNIKV